KVVVAVLVVVEVQDVVLKSNKIIKKYEHFKTCLVGIMETQIATYQWNFSYHSWNSSNCGDTEHFSGI
ncbi:MAG: hypothetical protein COX07_09275, partial [Bacteroidetes bacterium CG23_combo_of_CG06-09_8_20_14_all_32_9]